MNEAEIEHTVGFIEHQDLDTRKRQRLAFGKIEQAPGGRDENVDATRQLPSLPSDVDTTDDNRGRKAQPGTVGSEAVGDLAGQLPSRAQYQGPAAVRHRALRQAGKALEDGESEGRCLAGAGLGDAAKIAPGERRRDCVNLNGSGGCVAFGGKSAENRGRKPEIEEMNQDEYKPSGQSDAVSGAVVQVGRRPARLGLSDDAGE